SVLLMCAVILAELSGILSFQPWHGLATLCVICTMIAVAVKRRFQKTPVHQLLHPYHMKEVAEILQQATPSRQPVGADLSRPSPIYRPHVVADKSAMGAINRPLHWLATTF